MMGGFRPLYTDFLFPSRLTLGHPMLDVQAYALRVQLAYDTPTETRLTPGWSLR